MTLLVGFLAYGYVPDEITVHWSLGSEAVYWGPESLPKALGLFLVPAVSALVALVLWLLPATSQSAVISFEDTGYRLSSVLVLGSLLATELALVVLNLA